MDVQFYQTVPRRGQSWTDDETSILLDIWLDKFKDVTSFDQKNGQIYQAIATEISSRGFRKNAVQCRTRMKTLKRAFKQCNSSRRVGGLMSKLYWKIEKAVNLNKRNDFFPSNVNDGDAEKDGYEIVKTEILSDSDSENSFQDQDSLFGIADEKNDSLQAREYERLQMRRSSNKQDVVLNNSSGEIQQQMPSFQTNHETTIKTNLPFNHIETPTVPEQSGVFGKGHQVLGSGIPSSSASAGVSSLNSSVYQTGHQYQRKDCGISFEHNFVGCTDETIPDFDENSPKSPPSSVRTVPERNESLRNKMFTNSYNSFNEKDSRKRSLLNSESQIDNPCKKPRQGHSNFHSIRDTRISTNIQPNESHSCELSSDQNKTEEEILCVSPEVNQNESPSKTLFTPSSILETLYSLEKTLVSVVNQQTRLNEKLIDTEKERLVLRQKELEVELKKQENDKERIAMEERQRREDREHHYKVMQLVLTRLGPPSSGPEIQNGSFNLNDNKST